MSSFTVSMILSLVDRATGPLRAVTQKMQGMGAAAGKLNSPAQVKRMETAGKALATQALAAGGMAFALSRALRPAIAFESAMADVAKVVDFDGSDGVRKLGEDILKMSTRIPIAADGLAEIVAAAGQANLIDAALPDAEKSAGLLAFAEAAAKMGVAFDIGAAEAGQAMATLRNVFQLSQPQVERLADATNHLSNNMASTARDITNVITRTGGVSKLFGLAEEQAAALASSFLAVGLGPERAGTAINALLSRLATAPKQTDAFQGALAELGLNAEALKKAIGEDADGALLAFLERVRGSDDALGILTDLFGRENADEIALLTGSLDQARRAFGLVGDETAFAGSMQKEFEARSKTTQNAMEKLGNQMRRVQITLGSALLPALVDLGVKLEPVLNALHNWAKDNPDLIKTLVLVTAAVVGVRVAVAAPNFALAATPLGRAIAILVAGATLIIQYWEPIKKLFEDIAAAVTSLGETTFTFGGKTADGAPAAPNGTLLDPLFGGARAGGGPVRRGLSYLVGENGPELFSPGVAGNITAHQDLLSLARIPIDTRPGGGGAGRAAQGGGAVSVGAIHIHAAPGMDASAIADAVMRRIREAGRGARDLHDGPHYGAAVGGSF